MAFWKDRELTEEQQRKVDQIRADYEQDLEDAKLAMRRESRKELAAYKDKIADLHVELEALLTYKEQNGSLVERELKLDNREYALNAAESLLEARSDSLNDIKEANVADYEYHHTLANNYQDDAKELLRAAKVEFTDAKSESRKAGYNDGYANGFKDGIGHTSTLGTAALTEMAENARLALLTGANHNTLVVDGKPIEQGTASKALADAFAKHLTSTIDKAMTPKKETK